MAALLIEPTDLIEVSFVPVIIFGPPACGKTSLAQTALNPITLDFDEGIHRAQNRKRAMRFGNWNDVIEAQNAGKFADYQTLVLDTGGRALDLMIPQIMQESAKYAHAGSLSLQGWGVLGTRFNMWMKTIRAMRKDVVMICHQEEAKNAAGDAYFTLDLPGKMAYKEIHKSFDLIGRIRFDGRKRFLDFNPSDNSIGKNAAGWEPIEIIDLHQQQTFIADLIADAKRRIGATAEASAAVAKVTDRWQDWLDGVTDNLDAFNAGLSDLSQLDGAAKRQAWHMMQQHAESYGWEFDRASKTFRAKEAAA